MQTCPVCGRTDDVHYQVGYAYDEDGVNICESCADGSIDRYEEEYDKAREEFDVRFRAAFVERMIRAGNENGE